MWSKVATLQGEKIFFMNYLLQLSSLPLETYAPYIWDRIEKLWIVSSSEWWDDALWDSVSRVAFTLLSEEIRDTVNTSGTWPSILQHIWAAAKPELASASLYSTHLPRGTDKALQFPLSTPGSAALPCALTALPSHPGWRRVLLLQGLFGADWQESSRSLSQRCLGGKWCAALPSW